MRQFNKIHYQFFDKSFPQLTYRYSLPEYGVSKATMSEIQNNRNFVLNYLNSKNIVILKQVHGNDIYHAETSKYSIYNDPVADACITSNLNTVLAIKTADCVPILLFNQKQNLIGAIHGGWKSIKSGIVNKVKIAMHNLDNSKLMAIIGPSIQKYSYEVEFDFYKNFVATDSCYQIFFEQNSKSNEKKFYFDLPNLVKYQLLEAGIEVIEQSEDDTYERNDLYPSYRRCVHEKVPYNQNLLSAIVINKNN